MGVLDKASGVVLALRPTDQLEWIPVCSGRSNLRYLLLEKPLAHSPEVAASVFEDLLHTDKVFRIGYTFRYTDWGRRLLQTLISKNEGGFLSLQWSFMAHHYRYNVPNWKRFAASGGGAIRFYGIHVLALLAELGYRDVIMSQAFGEFSEEQERWSAIFTGTGLPEFKAVVDTRSPIDKFVLERISDSHGGRVTTALANLVNPFESIDSSDEIGRLDLRVPILTQLCRSLWEERVNEYDWYAAAIELWRTVEERLQFIQDSKAINLRNIGGLPDR